MKEQKNHKIFRMQPISCPWITTQPYHSSLLNKNRAPSQSDPTLANRFLNNPWTHKQIPISLSRSQDKSSPSIQQSSSQFFYFLRLMQLFPDTHPATLHTVLSLCKNDFFCTVDKMLYAKRCKLLCYKKNLIQKNQNRCNRNENESGKINPKSDSSKQKMQFNKIQLGNVNMLYKKKNEMSTVDLNLQKSPMNETILNCSEKPEDLSTVKTDG